MKMLAVLLLICGLSGRVSIIASQTQLDTVGDNIQRLEEEKAEEEKQMNILGQSQSLLYQELGELDKNLSEIAGSLIKIEERRKELSSILESLQKEREAVEEKEQEYHDSMKMRIRFLYENGDEHFLSLVMQAKSFTEAWDKLTYINEIHEYDRRMLEEYRRICEDISWKEEKYEQEQQEVQALEEELYERKIEAQNLISEIKMSLLRTENMLDQTQGNASEYETLIAGQKEYERELEVLKEQEEEKIQEQWRQYNSVNESLGTSSEALSEIAYNPVENDLDLLAAIIQCEADGESHEGKLAVGSVVMNRIHSPQFPNSMVEVLYQNRQFTPVGSGRFAVVLARGANSNCYAAAREVLAGKITLDCLFFRTNNGSKQGIVIGNHVFY